MIMRTLIQKKMKMMIKNIKYYLVLLALLVLFLTFKSYTVNSASEFPTLNASQLAIYNGVDLSKPVYIAYDGLIYDVSSGRNDYYNVGKPYHHLAGRDSTVELNLVGGTIIKSKYKIVARYSIEEN